jgi:hypothetical protein
VQIVENETRVVAETNADKRDDGINHNSRFKMQNAKFKRHGSA